MSTEPTRKPRGIDGFTRRPITDRPAPRPALAPEEAPAVAPQPPVTPVSAPNPAPVQVAEVPTEARVQAASDTRAVAAEAPGFEYRKPKRRFRLTRRRMALAVLAVLVAGGSWFGYVVYAAASHVITKAVGKGAPALSDDVTLADLKGEGSGRINILVMGEGGEGHEGAELTDTIMVWSIDPKTKSVAAVSVPRDLYVKIPAATNANGAKTSAHYSKINAANVSGGPALTQQIVENIIGVPIHYYVTVDFSGFKQAIDAVGGIDINVKEALFDRTYPCENSNKYCPYKQAAGQTRMDGTTALKYARCRHDAPVGNCGNDQGRALRQQEVIAALRAKALSAGTLTNPIKLAGLISAVGSHVTTDMQLNEIKKLALIAKDVDTSKINGQVLDDSPTSYLTGGVNIIPSAGYIYVPKLGNFNYSAIQDFVKGIFVDGYITDEAARVEVQNGSGISGLAGTVTTSLEAAHYTVLPPVNAGEDIAKTVIYDYTNGKKPYTINYLEQRFGVKAQKANLPSPSATPAGTSGDDGTADSAAETPQIRIILGSDYKATSTDTTNSN